MTGLLAILLCTIGVAVLFHFDRDKSVRNSKALWLPVVWLGLAGSRGVSSWLGIGPPPGGLQGTLEGSPVDAAVFALLLIIGFAVLLNRSRKTAAYLPAITPIIIYSIYCLLSVFWAPYSLPAFKRWTKDVGDVVVALVIVTDPRPVEAVRRFFSRAGFVLLPFSIVLIRYTTLGRAWDADGRLSIVGVTTHKNSLGLICFVVSLATLWNFRWLLMNRGEPNRNRRLVVQGVLLGCGLYLLKISHSSTSLACFLLGSGIMLAMHLRAFRQRPSRVHWLCLPIVLMGWGVLTFGGMGDVASALGRDSTFSGRTLMWNAMLGAVSNPLIGVGFDSFWTSPNAESFHGALNRLQWYHPEGINEAHNGYLEVFLNLGWIGVCLISLILITGYLRAARTLKRDRELGSMLIAFIVSGAIYSVTEAGFRTLNPMWIVIVLTVVSACGANAGLFVDARAKRSRVRVPADYDAESFRAAHSCHETDSARRYGMPLS